MGRQFALFYLTVLTLVMGAALAYGFIVGDFWEDGGELVDNPWGIVSLFGVSSAFSSSSAGSFTEKVVRGSYWLGRWRSSWAATWSAGCMRS